MVIYNENDLMIYIVPFPCLPFNHINSYSLLVQIYIYMVYLISCLTSSDNDDEKVSADCINKVKHVKKKFDQEVD